MEGTQPAIRLGSGNYRHDRSFNSLLDNTPEIQAQIRKDHLCCISPRRHRDPGARMTAGTTQINVRDGGFVLAELGNRTQRAVLIRKKRALPERTVHGTGDFARDVDRRMGHTSKNLVLQVGNVVGGNEVNEVISVRFARLVPSASRNSAGRIAGDNVWDAQHDEFHERLTGWRATLVYGGIILTHDHRRRRQCATATLEINSREEIERWFGKMNMRGLARSRSGFVIDRAVERNEHDKNGIAPLVLLHFPDDLLSHHPRAEQVEHEVTGVHIRDD